MDPIPEPEILTNLFIFVKAWCFTHKTSIGDASKAANVAFKTEVWYFGVFFVLMTSHLVAVESYVEEVDSVLLWVVFLQQLHHRSAIFLKWSDLALLVETLTISYGCRI